MGAERHGLHGDAVPGKDGTRQILQTDAARGTDEVWLKQIMAPVLDALRMLFRHYFHRDLSPDNIMILESGAPMCCWTSTRQVIGDMTQALTALILKPGFAPIGAVRG